MNVLLVALAILGWLAALLATYLLAMSVSSLLYRPRRTTRPPAARLVVLIPAHDEERLIASCVRSLTEQSYPRELRSIAVIADNCTDRTATVARDAGADLVLERHNPSARGKGRALRWAMDVILDGEDRPDAIVVVDADSTAEPDLLAGLAAEFEAGAQAVQGDYVLRSSGAGGAALRAAAFLLVNRVRQAGRSVLGQSAHLVGNGMLFSSDLLSRQPWDAFTSTEDLEYTLDLQLEGVKVAFAGAARVHSETAPNAAAAATQQRRWEGGRMHLLRSRTPQLLREAVLRRRPGLLVLAFDVAMPPLGLLAGGVVAGGAATAVAAAIDGDPRALLPWGVAAAAIPLYVIVGLKAGRAPRSAYRALAGAPMLVLRKPLQMRGILSFRPDSWVRTQRAHEGGGDSA